MVNPRASIRGRAKAGDEPDAAPQYMTRAEVAAMLGVSPNTVARWARDGRIACQLTLGGHRRFERSTILELVERLRRDR